MKQRFTGKVYNGVFLRSQACMIKDSLFIFLICTIISLGCTVVRDGSGLDDDGKVGVAEPAPLEERHVNVLLRLPESHFPEEMKRGQILRLSIRKQHTHAALQHEILEISE